MSNFGIESLLLSLPPIQRASAAITNVAAPYVNEYLLPNAQILVSNPWYCYGFGPVIAVFVGMMLNVMLLEWLASQSWMQKHLITYSRNETRAGELEKTHAKIPWIVQFKETLLKVGGPMNLVGCAAQRYALEYLHGGLPSSPLPSLVGFLVDFILLAFIADFFLYWGHRIQHHNKWLWDNSHSLHHRLQTPSAAGTAYVADKDVFLQSVIPLTVSAFVIRPHPITHLCYLYHHLSNNALNHSGIQVWWLDILSLKFLPFRCDNRLHDAHHRFSGFGDGAKNFGEWTWFWDWLFGTLSQTSIVMTRKRE